MNFLILKIDNVLSIEANFTPVFLLCVCYAFEMNLLLVKKFDIK